MAGPWEKYAQQPAAAQPEGPWLNYQSEGQTIPQAFTNAFAPQNALPALQAPPEAVQASVTPDVQQAMHQAEVPQPSAFGTGALQGMTLGFGDELMAGLLSPIEAGVRAYRGEDSGKGLLDRLGSGYDAALDRERGVLKTAERDHPVAETLGNLGGGLALGSTLSNGGVTLLKGAPTVAKAAGEGALYGAAQGLGEGEGLKDRLKRAAAGGATGGVLGGIFGRIAETLATKQMMKQVPSTEDIKDAAQLAYKQADQAGLILKPQGIQTLATDIKTDLANDGFLPRLHPRIAATLDEIDNVAGQNVTLKGVDVLRRVANNAKMSTDPSEARLGGKIVNRLDDYLNNLGPADILTGDAAGVDALKEARKLWSTTKKSELVAEAVTKAERRAASTGSGGNVDNAIRQNIRGILDNPKKSAPFTDAEKAAMEVVVRGTKTQNLARLIGKLSPEGNGLMLTLGAGGAAASGGMTLPLSAAGYISKRIADTATPSNVRILEAIMRSGGNLPPKQLTAGQRLIFEALTRQGAQKASEMLPMGR